MIGVLAWSVIGHTSESSLEQKSPFIFPIYFYTTPSAHKRKVFREETFNSKRSFQKKSTLCKDFSEILWNCAWFFSEGFPTHRSGNGPFCVCVSSEGVIASLFQFSWKWQQFSRFAFLWFSKRAKGLGRSCKGMRASFNQDSILQSSAGDCGYNF